MEMNATIIRAFTFTVMKGTSWRVAGMEWGRRRT
jgi:hypothetical protein